MSSNIETRIERARRELGSGRYSACDISDALLKLKVPQAGFLPDIVPIPLSRAPTARPIIAPISTVLFVPKTGPLPSSCPSTSNIPEGTHFTDYAPPGSVAVLQQHPRDAVCAVLGDIMATRLQVRGIRAIVADGRVRDVYPIGRLCDETAPTTGGEADGEMPLSVWSRGTSTVGTGLECKAWCVDVPLQIGQLEVRSGDLMCVDERERGCVVIPQDKIDQVVDMLPALKDIDDRCVADVQAGIDVTEVFRRHR